MLFFAALVTAQDDIPRSLRDMADTERAFAQAATVKGVRDAFLEFFADDALALVPAPTSYKERLRARPSVPFSENELRWEPRLGDVAASGELGWLTGPSTFINHKDKQPPRHGNYLSVWKKQADGSWKVLLDVGSQSPTPVPFAPGFHRFAVPTRYTGKTTKADATATLEAADRRANAGDPPLADGARIHRDGMPAVVGREAALAWLGRAGPTARTTGRAESAASGDVGYTFGTYETPGDPAARGSYIRVWSRDAAGRWLVVVDVQNQAPPR